jgi:DmsE family decaheme c-type cytochrome
MVLRWLVPLTLCVPLAAADYAGSEACKTCHANIWFNFYKNPHYRSVASGDQPPERTGCEGCHGPGQAHIAAHGGKTTIPRAFSLMSSEAAMNTCLTCHARDFYKINVRRSTHSLNDVSCTSCHSIHKSPDQRFLLAKTQRDLCYGCHQDVRAQFDMPFKHRVNEGFMNCTDCHNPHGAFAPTWRMNDTPRMVTQANGNQEACLKCHADKRGPFMFEHPPVRVEGCEICHYPHGSTNARLLVRPVTFTLCLQCHNGADSFGDRNNGITQLSPSSHNLLDPRYQRCTTCHVRIHGSNGSPYFLR